MTTGAEVAPPRRNAASTRELHLRRILRGRLAGYAFALGVLIVFVLGAWLHSLLVMLGGPLLVCVLVIGIAFRAADARAEQEFFVSFAAARGLRYVGETVLVPLTPLLGAGARRECRHWMVGPLGDRVPDVGCGLGHYTWFERRRGDGDTARWIPRHFTICVVDLEQGIRMFPGVFLASRRDLSDMLGGGWLRTANRRKVELESMQLHERYDLWVDRTQDELLLRQLFSPSFVAWLAEHPLEPCFEYRAGTLVVYVERKVEDAGHLGWLQDATHEIAFRLAREVAEGAANGVAAASTRGTSS